MSRCLSRRGPLGVLLVVTAALLALPTIAEAAPAPAWDLAQTAMPSTFSPGETSVSTGLAQGAFPLYYVQVTNLGSATTTGAVNVVDTLPTGIEPSEHPAEIRVLGPETSFNKGCTVTGQTVICTTSTPVVSGDQFVVVIPVDVSASAPASVQNRVLVEGGGASPVATTTTTPVSSSPSRAFEFRPGQEGMSGVSITEDGLPAAHAGSHPYALMLEASFPTRRVSGVPSVESVVPTQQLKNLKFKFPQGFVINPQATPHCTEAQFIAGTNGGKEGGCPQGTQVGYLNLLSPRLGGAGILRPPLYNMVPPPGVPAEFAFNALGTTVQLEGGLDGSFHLLGGSQDILAKLFIPGIQVVLWGSPSDPSHNWFRQGAGDPNCRAELGVNKGNECAVTALSTPMLVMPTACGHPPILEAVATSWEEPSREVGSTGEYADGGRNPFGLEGCNALEFGPTISSKATTDQPESPSGLEFDLRQPQSQHIEGLSAANLKTARVTLPPGMVLNPSSAAGLGACSEEQVGYRSEAGKIHFATSPQSCPNSAKVGTVEASTPLLDHKLPGSIYLAKPFANPFGSLLAIYLAIEDEQSGITVKLAGKVEPDPTTGQLTTSFDENPDLPVEDISLHFFNGARAVLTTPATCGAHTTVSTMTPWSSPEGGDTHPSDSFQIGGACSASEASAPASVLFAAGTISPLSGAYSPFVLRLSRKDGTQHITGIDTTLPEGLLGKIAGVPYCPESAIDLAKGREAVERGKEEQSSPSCPAASEVGTVSVTAGSGISPYQVSGHAYLAGPYKGAPLSLVVIVPAVAGPFDLGTVVTRVALNVGEYDARIHATSDPLPTILDGIPLDVRSIELKLDRPTFTLNPTSCDAMAIEGSVSTQAGRSAPLKNRFQVGECGRLAFKPTLKLSLKGATKRTGHPALKAVVTYPPQGDYANIARAQVSLPHSEFLDQGNIGKACTKTLIAVKACPAKSIYGRVKAWTPLLAQPLEGPVYLVGGYGYKLPALVAELNGQIRVLLVGKVDTDKQKGIRNTFEAVPDAPVSRFVLQMKGGKKYGLLENSENICRKAQKAGTAFTAQNGRVEKLSVRIANSCGKKRHKKRHHRAHRGHKRHKKGAAKGKHHGKGSGHRAGHRGGH